MNGETQLPHKLPHALPDRFKRTDASELEFGGRKYKLYRRGACPTWNVEFVRGKKRRPYSLAEDLKAARAELQIQLTAINELCRELGY